MPTDKATILQQIGNVLQHYHAIRGGHLDHHENFAPPIKEATELIVRLRATLKCLAPLNSPYPGVIEREEGISNGAYIDQLAGSLAALQGDYLNGLLLNFVELVHADLFSDFLEMAAHLLEKNFKQPAAVLVGCVMEQHLHKLCTKHGIDLSPKDAKTGENKPRSSESLNQELAKVGIITKNEQKQLTAWYGIRNSAAHGRPDEFDEREGRTIHHGVAGFHQPAFGMTHADQPP